MQHGRLIADFSGERMVFHAGNGKPIEDLPFEVASAKKPLAVVETTVNGAGPYRFAVDTGAMGTCIALHVAKEVGVKKGQRGERQCAPVLLEECASMEGAARRTSMRACSPGRMCEHRRGSAENVNARLFS